MKIESANKQQIEWADKVWDDLWDNNRVIGQRGLHQYLVSSKPEIFRFLHDEFNKLRLPIDIHFGDSTIKWISAEDFKWDEDEQTWTVKNGSGAIYTIVKS